MLKLSHNIILFEGFLFSVGLINTKCFPFTRISGGYVTVLSIVLPFYSFNQVFILTYNYMYDGRIPNFYVHEVDTSSMLE